MGGDIAVAVGAAGKDDARVELGQRLLKFGQEAVGEGGVAGEMLLGLAVGDALVGLVKQVVKRDLPGLDGLGKGLADPRGGLAGGGDDGAVFGGDVGAGDRLQQVFGQIIDAVEAAGGLVDLA